MSSLKVIGASEALSPCSISPFRRSPACPSPGNLETIASIASFCSPSGSRDTSPYMSAPAGASEVALEAASSLPHAASGSVASMTAVKIAVGVRMCSSRGSRCRP